MKKKILPLLVAGALGLGGCSGGGAGSTEKSPADNIDDDTGSVSIQGLDMPVTLSIVTAKESTAAREVSGLKVNWRGVALAFNDADTEYSTDPQNAWVQDRALEPLDQVNEILCYMDQIRADQLVNKTYVALVDEASCTREEQGSDGQNQSSGGGKTTQLNKWIVESTRESNDSEQIVKIWAPDQGGDEEGAMEVRAEATIYEGVSDANPYGKFVMNFQGVALESFTNWDQTQVNTGDTTMEGTLKTVDAINGKIGFTLYNSSPIWNFTSKATVVTDADGSAGVAFTGASEPDWENFMGEGTPDMVEKAFAVAFNESNILIQPADSIGALANIQDLNGDQVEMNGGACLSRTAFKRNVWRYDLYGSDTGARVKLNSGFPFRADTDDDGNLDTYGWVGYYGLWSEKEPAGGWDGREIVKEDHGSNATEESYTIVETAGKLIKREKSTVLLTELDGVTFNYNSCDMNGCNEFKMEYDSNGTVNDNVAVSDGDGFYKTHTVLYSNDGPPQETAITPQRIDTTQPGQEWLGMWSEALGGSVSFQNGNDHITFYKESNVNADDSEFGTGTTLTLNCYTECLKPDLTAAQYQDPWVNDAYYPDAADGTNPASAVTYVFDKSTLSLTVSAVAGNTSHADVGKVVKLAEAFNPQQGGFEPWGIAINAMVLSDATVMHKYDTWDQDLSFRWETGHNSWNKLTAVKDAADNQITFDKPMAFSYKHLQANDANAPDASTKPYGKTFLLQYSGNGDLWGIPWIEDGQGGYSRPAFAIKDGTQMGPTGIEYVIKARDMELKPKRTDGQCSGENGLVLNQPAAPLPEDVDGAPSNANTEAPTLDDEAPAAIGGEVVAQSES
jgi:hypothetical protein